MHVAASIELENRVLPALTTLRDSIHQKAESFRGNAFPLLKVLLVLHASYVSQAL